MTLAINVQHSAESAAWYTPGDIVERARAAIGGHFDFDPASDDLANTVVKARQYATEHDGLGGFGHSWRGCIWLNPPTPPREWWERLQRDVLTGDVCRAVFVAYSLEQLSQSQLWSEKSGLPHMLDFPVCIPRRRIAYLRGVDGKLVKGAAPPHASAIIGVGIARSHFAREFSSLGVVL